MTSFVTLPGVASPQVSLPPCTAEEPREIAQQLKAALGQVQPPEKWYFSESAWQYVRALKNYITEHPDCELQLAECIECNHNEYVVEFFAYVLTSFNNFKQCLRDALYRRLWTVQRETTRSLISSVLAKGGYSARYELNQAVQEVVNREEKLEDEKIVDIPVKLFLATVNELDMRVRASSEAVGRCNGADRNLQQQLDSRKKAFKHFLRKGLETLFPLREKMSHGAFSGVLYWMVAHRPDLFPELLPRTCQLLKSSEPGCVLDSLWLRLAEDRSVQNAVKREWFVASGNCQLLSLVAALCSLLSDDARLKDVEHIAKTIYSLPLNEEEALLAANSWLKFLRGKDDRPEYCYADFFLEHCFRKHRWQLRLAEEENK